MIPELCIDREHFRMLCVHHAEKLRLRFGHVLNINFADDANRNIFAKAERARRVALLAADRYIIVTAEENVYLVAHARVHRVADNAKPDAVFNDAESAIGRIFYRFKRDDSAIRQFLRQIA